MRPRLLDDVHFVESADGVYVCGPQGACTITGSHSHAWLSRLAPHLTGEHSLAELTESLSAERRMMVERLVGVLAEQRFIIDARSEEPHTLSEREQEIYAPEIAYIGYTFDSAGYRFERLRKACIALTVTGDAHPVVEALVEAGLGSGWRVLRVAGVRLADLADAIDRGRRDSAQQIVAAQGIAAEADVVLHVHAGASIDELTAVASACKRDGVALGQVWLRDDEAWLTDVRDDGPTAYWPRLTGLRREVEGAQTQWLTGAVPMVIAAQMALGCFEHLTGMARPAARPAMTRIDLRTLDTRLHRVQPLRLAGVRDAGGVLSAEPPARSAVAEPVADLLERAAGYVDPRTGVLGELDEGGLLQVPLRVCGARVSDPGGLLPSWAPVPRVFGWGADGQTARLRALLAGLATYQALLAAQSPVVPYVAPAGIAAGLSWPQAVAGGLVQLCDVLVGRADRAEFPTVPVLLDPRARGLADLLEAAGEPVVIRDLTAVLGIPAYAVGGAAAACGTTAVTAMRRALDRALLAWQGRTGDEPYAGLVARWADDICDDVTEAEHAVEAFTKALADAGRVPVVSVLDRDTTVAELLPFVARVVCDE
jgi:hypothetical protein